MCKTVVVRILLDNTGKGKLEIISILAEEPLKQKEIVKESSMSKGSVSANIQKLEKNNLIIRENEIKLNQYKLIELYREHLETFLIRKNTEPEDLNNLRTYMKENFAKMIKANSQELTEVILNVLKEAKSREDLESLNSVFKETDRIIRETEKNNKLEIIGLITDLSNSTVKKQSGNAKRAKNILEQLKEA